MEVLKAYKVKLYPSNVEEQGLYRTLGASRFVWNYNLAKRRDFYLEHKKTISYATLSRDLTVFRNNTPWLQETDRTILDQSLRRFDSSYNRFFRKLSMLPKFKSKHDSKQSFQKYKGWHIEGKRIMLSKTLSFKFRGNIGTGERRTLVVMKTPTGWYASILMREEIKVPKKHTKPIGIDLGINHLAITSDGKKFANLNPMRTAKKQLKKLSQSLSRKKKGSSRRQKAKGALARFHEKIRNRRQNHLHQISYRICERKPSLIATEDLSVLNMTKNHSLAFSIADVGWSGFLKMLEYKQLWRGGKFVQIDRFFPSSKTCHKCHYIIESLPLNVRSWNCPNCGTKHDRDVNAAKVILQQGEELPAPRKATIALRRSANAVK